MGHTNQPLVLRRPLCGCHNAELARVPCARDDPGEYRSRLGCLPRSVRRRAVLVGDAASDPAAAAIGAQCLDAGWSAAARYRFPERRTGIRTDWSVVARSFRRYGAPVRSEEHT